MTRTELEAELDTLIIETATLSKKDRDRLVGALTDFLVDDMGLDIEEEEFEEEKK